MDSIIRLSCHSLTIVMMQKKAHHSSEVEIASHLIELSQKIKGVATKLTTSTITSRINIISNKINCIRTIHYTNSNIMLTILEQPLQHFPVTPRTIKNKKCNKSKGKFTHYLTKNRISLKLMVSNR